jgi:site-specific DNA-methyltransferase (adenine-specific)
MVEAGMKFAQLLIWVKTHAVIGRMDYAPQHELIAYGWFGTHEFLKSKDKSVLVCPRPNKSAMHPTTKPLDLIRRLILNSTRIGDVVYDGFLGSGTTLLACEQTKRVCIGVELDPEYCQTIIFRFEKLTGLKAEKYE